MSARRGRRGREEVLGVLGVVALVAAVVAALAVHARALDDTVVVTVDTDRAGLTLDDRSEVTLRGVTVGHVRRVEPVGGRARVTLAVERAQAPRVPSTSTVDIVAPTLLGPKFVALQPPARPGRPLADGDVLRASLVGSEYNDTFGALMRILTRVDAAKLQSTLGAVSTALRGRGDGTGQLLVDLQDTVARLRPVLPALRRDLATGADVSGTYARLAPDLVRVLAASPTTAETLVRERDRLRALHPQLSGLGAQTRAVVEENDRALLVALATGRPTTDLMAMFAPTFPCLFAATDQVREALQRVVGGTRPGIGLLTSVQAGRPGYHAPDDLPVVGAQRRPSCEGAPLPRDRTSYQHPPLRDGATTLEQPAQPRVVLDARDLASTLLGPPLLPLSGVRR